MAKLAPPIVLGTIPAFYTNSEGTTKIVVPFGMNRAVSLTQISGFLIKIKTVASTTYLSDWACVSYDATTNMEAYFVVSNDLLSKLHIGQYYKIQLAYINQDGQVGYYSQVSTVKYTTLPTVYIQDLYTNKINSHLYQYTGCYSQEGGDITERVYKYRFIITESDSGEIFADSEWQIHNSENDTELEESCDSFTCNYDLEYNKNYRILYSIITINNINYSSIKYKITTKASISIDNEFKILPTLDFDNGYIHIGFLGTIKDDGLEEVLTGNYLLSRSSEDSNYLDWEELMNFKIIARPISNIYFDDFTIEQGKNYRYGIMQYNDNGLYSDRRTSKIIYADFEDAFLYDGERLLKIRFNPKVATFKSDILESKSDTIGNKYPFIFRNGYVNYKEFTISGLISYLSDEENLFTKGKDVEDLLDYRTTDLVNENIMKERSFKLEVLDWLNNGENKIFRSPTEGNYIVRLMNISLAPTDSVGRMLHTFTCTAYEMADFKYENFADFIYVEDTYSTDELITKWKTVKVSDILDSSSYTIGLYVLVNDKTMLNLKLENLMPGTIIKFDLSNDGNILEVLIGATGLYLADVEITKLYLPVTNNILDYSSTLLTYAYEEANTNHFSTIDDVEITEIPSRQFFGPSDIIKDILYIYDSENEEYIRDLKTELVKVMQMTFRLKEGIALTLYKHEEGYYTKVNYEDYEFDILSDANPYYVYPVKDADTDEFLGYLTYENNNFVLKESKEELDSTITINGSLIDISDIGSYKVDKVENPTEITIGNNVIAEITYQNRYINYLDESSDASLILLNKYLTKALSLRLTDIANRSKAIISNKSTSYNDAILNDNDTILNYYLNIIKTLARLKADLEAGI